MICVCRIGIVMSPLGLSTVYLVHGNPNLQLKRYHIFQMNSVFLLKYLSDCVRLRHGHVIPYKTQLIHQITIYIALVGHVRMLGTRYNFGWKSVLFFQDLVPL